jgi:hypothetical protein
MPEKEPSYQEVPKGAYERWRENSELEHGERGKCNSYADNFYTANSPDDSNIPAFKLNPTIDKIKLGSIPARFLNRISGLLEENGFKKGRVTTPKGKYDRNRRFNDGMTGIKIFYNLGNSERGAYPIYIEINDPTQEIIDLLNSFFRRFSISPNISQLEIAFDFITDEPGRLRHLLDKHLFLRYQWFPSFRYKNTTYTTDLRKSCKGTRTYPKIINGQKVVRLELVLNRKIVKKLKLEFPLRSIEKTDFKKYFSFKKLRLTQLLAYRFRANEQEIENLNKKEDWDAQLLLRQIENWERIFIPEDPWEEELMPHVEALKKSRFPNYNRFLKDEDDLNQQFQKALRGKRFFPITKKK